MECEECRRHSAVDEQTLAKFVTQWPVLPTVDNEQESECLRQRDNLDFTYSAATQKLGPIRTSIRDSFATSDLATRSYIGDPRMGVSSARKNFPRAHC